MAERVVLALRELADALEELQAESPAVWTGQCLTPPSCGGSFAVARAACFDLVARCWQGAEPSCPEAGYPARAPALSRARRRDGAPDLVLTLPRQGSRPGPVSGEGTRTAAEHLRAAMTQAAVALGDEEIAQGLTAAQVLEDTAATNSATRWRSGPESVATAEAASTSSSWRSRLNWLGSRLNLRTLGLLLVVVLFPRLLAFLVAMGVRLVASLLVRLSSRIIRELVMQIALLAADLESQVIDWLYNAWLEAQAPTTVVLPLASSPSPPLPSVTSPAPPQTVTVALPARPMDYLTLFLLLLQVLRSWPGGWDIGKMPGDHSEDRASNRRIHGKEGVLLFGPNGVLAHMRDPEHRHQAMLPPSGPPQGIERRLEERKAAKQARTNEILEEGRCHFMLGSATVNSLRKRLSAKPRRQRSACRSAKIWCGSSDHTSSGPRCRVGTGQSRDHHLASYWNPEALAEKNRALGCHGTECIDPGASAKKWGMFQGKCEAEDLDRKRTRLACKMDILDFFRGYRKAVHKLTADQQKVLQANLHGAHGQRALMDAKVCMLGSSAIATESLKNLVLPGIGQFTIVDNAKVEAQTEAHVDQEPAKAVAQGKEFFRHFSFSLVIACQVTELVAAQLGRLCEELQIPLVLITSLGFVGKIRLFVTEHCVCETKPDSEFGDLRLTDPFPELRRFADSIDFASLNDTEHAHAWMPYVIPDAAQQVLSHVANASKSDFWIVARAVSQFVRDCGKLPLAGSLPDMTAWALATSLVCKSVMAREPEDMEPGLARLEDSEVHVELFRTRAAAYVHRTVHLLSALSREPGLQCFYLSVATPMSGILPWLFPVVAVVMGLSLGETIEAAPQELRGFLLGMASAAGSSPCATPVLAAIGAFQCVEHVQGFLPIFQDKMRASWLLAPVPARVSRLPGQVGVYEYSPVRLREEAVDWQ
eukprot:s322_g5.t1